MRIAHLGLKGFPARFGADRAAEAVIRRLSGRHEITVYCSSGYTPADASLPGVRLIRIPGLPGKYTHMTSVDFLAAWHAVLYGNYQLIHLHNIEASFVLPILKPKYPVITTARGRITPGNKWGKVASAIMRSMEFPYVLWSDVAVSVSQPDAQQFSAAFQHPVTWIPNGVEISPEIDDEAAQNLLLSNHLPAQGYILFAAGRIIPLKGAHLLLEAFRTIPDNYHLIIVGDLSHSPQYALELQSLAGPRVTFIPFVSSPSTLLGLVKRSCLFVFPSLSEGMSNMLLEVASIGIPIVCSDIPANKSVLPEQALLFSSGSADDLADKLQWALDHFSEMQNLGLLAQSLVHEKYSWDVIANAYEQLYLKVINSS